MIIKVIGILLWIIRIGFGSILGMAIAFLSYSFFREQIQQVFRWATFDRIDFIGKNFYFFADPFYYISFGITLTLFALANKRKSLNRIVKNAILLILVFAIFVFGISAINANAEIAACTACEDKIRVLHWNAVNYELILGGSALLSLMLSLVFTLRNRKSIA